MSNTRYSFEYFKASADYVRSIVPYQPEIAVVLGTALGPLADMIENPITIDYKDIPNFLLATAHGHAGKLIFGTICGRKIVCMSGRFHFYEGYDFEQLVIPVRLFKLLGAKVVILTNAAGAVNVDYHPGDVMIIEDHIKLAGSSPLCGKNIDEFGPRHFSTVNIYTPALRELALKCAAESDITVHEGVYMFFTGPQFETPAEIRAARILGADAVGMSTVTEALTAAHCEMPMLALSLMTNMAAGVIPNQPTTSDEVDITAAMVAQKFSKYVKDIISRIGEISL